MKYHKIFLTTSDSQTKIAKIRSKADAFHLTKWLLTDIKTTERRKNHIQRKQKKAKGTPKTSIQIPTTYSSGIFEKFFGKPMEEVDCLIDRPQRQLNNKKGNRLKPEKIANAHLSFQ